MGKSWVTKIGRETMRLGSDIMGEQFPLKYLLDMEVIYTYEGTYDINALVSGRDLTGIPAFKL